MGELNYEIARHLVDDVVTVDEDEIANAVLLIGIVAVYNLNDQVGWWDIFVSPRHNIRATNNGKVLGAHQPFLLATLTLLIMYGDAGMFLLLYIFAMAASAVATHQ